MSLIQNRSPFPGPIPGTTASSGIGSERALEAISTIFAAQRESRASPELPVGRRTHPAEPKPTTTQQRVPSLGVYVATYANSPLITSPAMSVSRKSRPSKRCVKRVCSMPNR